MSAHTPAPWVLGNENNQCCDVECGGGRTSVSLNRFDSLMRDEFAISRAEMLANAHLIAAAPDLLEALRMVRDADEDCRRDGMPRWCTDAARHAIDAAIAKAEGKS